MGLWGLYDELKYNTSSQIPKNSQSNILTHNFKCDADTRLSLSLSLTLCPPIGDWNQILRRAEERETNITDKATQKGGGRHRSTSSTMYPTNSPASSLLIRVS